MLAAHRDFAATDVRFLRSAVGSSCDLMGVAVRTLEAFGMEDAALAECLVPLREAAGV